MVKMNKQIRNKFSVTPDTAFLRLYEALYLRTYGVSVPAATMQTILMDAA